MTERFYAFVIRKNGRFYELQSFRDTCESDARRQAEVYKYRLEYYSPDARFTVVRATCRNS